MVEIGLDTKALVPDLAIGLAIVPWVRNWTAWMSSFVLSSSSAATDGPARQG
jgi:hypothetical protein